MESTLEQKVAELEHRLAALEARQLLTKRLPKDPLSTFGTAASDPFYDAAARAGEEYRRSQTYAKEIEDRGGVGY